MPTEPAEVYGLKEQFGDLEQQHETDVFGMWLFLGTEVLFFGAVFTAYTVYRTLHPIGFSEAAEHMEVAIGTINTAVLLTSSFFVALAVRASKLGQSRMVAALLALTVILGAVFLGLKAIEYMDHVRDHEWPGTDFHFLPDRYAAEAKLFFCFYFVMTGFHALHVLIGMLVLGGIGVKAWRGRYTAEYNSSVEVAALYWHFVDVVWIFLYPVLYLMKIKGV